MGEPVVEDIINVGGFATSVLKCGDVLTNNLLVLVIPGNPGVAWYYAEFMKTLYEQSNGQIPVWCVSHVGHGALPPSEDNTNDTGKRYGVHGLNAQITHKLTFIKENISPDVKLILIGHSIGCYIILHMLSDLDSDRALKGLFLFPTIEKMALTDKGRAVTPWLKYLYWGLHLPLYPVHYLLPSFIKRSIIRWHFKGRNVPECAIEATMRLTNPTSIHNVVFMSNQEMHTVQEVDLDLIENNLDRLMFYYGATDNWCPVEYYDNMKAKFPRGDIQLCQKDFEHAFVLGSSDGMAEILWKWLAANVTISKQSK